MIDSVTDLEFHFRTLGPWVTKFVIDGVPYGGTYNAAGDVRLAQFVAAFPGMTEVLELGSLEGGHTVALSRLPQMKRVVAIEARQANLARARLIQRVMDLRNVEFLQGDLERYDLTPLGSFDAVFCVGLLYHLSAPWTLLKRIAAVSPRLFLWTHYAAEDTVDRVINGYRGAAYREGGLTDPLSGLSPTSFWPTLAALRQMLADHGYRQVEIVKDDPNHQNGPAVTLTATTF